MTTKNIANRTAQQAADQKLMDGITKHEQAITSLILLPQKLAQFPSV